MNGTKKTLIIILLTAALASFLTYEFISPTPQVSLAPLQQQLKNDQGRIDAINKGYTLDMKKLQKKNDSLMQVVSFNKASLKLSDQKVSQLERKVSRLADTLNKEPDTLKSKIALGDSLGKDAIVLISQEAQRDSLCEKQVSDLSLAVNEKDSALADCQGSYISMKQAADTALQQQQGMILQIKGLNKQLKRKTAQSRLLSAGFLILTGIAATLYLSHQ
ncbi:MAG: hypothetical protein KGJ07_10055 [Patescibacteria group bacterium]|nr:hypothetical protein [Patescibacteria group bacterium]